MLCAWCISLPLSYSSVPRCSRVHGGPPDVFVIGPTWCRVLSISVDCALQRAMIWMEKSRIYYNHPKLRKTGPFMLKTAMAVNGGSTLVMLFNNFMMGLHFSSWLMRMRPQGQLMAARLDRIIFKPLRTRGFCEIFWIPMTFAFPALLIAIRARQLLGFPWRVRHNIALILYVSLVLYCQHARCPLWCQNLIFAMERLTIE